MPTGVKIERVAQDVLMVACVGVFVWSVSVVTLIEVEPPADRTVNEYVGPERNAEASEYHQP